MAAFVARAAAALRRSHPNVFAREVLNVVMRQRTGSLADFGDQLEPGSDFALIVVAAFDSSNADDWLVFRSWNADHKWLAALRSVWTGVVLPRLASAYGLTS